MDYKYTTPGPYASIVDGTLKSGDSLEIDNTLSKSVLYIANQGSSAIIRPSGIVPSAGQSMSIDGKLTINLLAPTAMVNIIQGGGPPAVGNVSANLRVGTQGVITVNGSGPDSRAMFGGATTTVVLQNQGAINISNSSLYGCKVSNYVSGLGGAASNPRGKINLSGVYLQGGGKYPFSILSKTSTFIDISYQDISINN
ncbi:hypothetical protein ABHV46_05765 [Asaia sp. BMEF1]|uniref:hypothetical protein n=1 Tax=Asaia sp. BMEF1 TaxID=3155932 RepID=UPI003F6787E9